MKLLSIIIPIYNAEEYLEECLNSIIASVGDYRHLVELILIDDGSTDASLQICNQYADLIPEVRVFHKNNEGVSSARNLGLQKAQGQYIAWIDPDDFVSEDWFPSIYAVVNKSDPDVIIIDIIRIEGNQTTPEIYGRAHGFVEWDVFAEDVIRDFRIHSGLPNKIMKRHLFNGVLFDISLKTLEDYAVMPHILRNRSSVYYIPKCLYYYRQHNGSLLHNSDAAMAFQSIQTALSREKAVDKRYQRAAKFSAAWQAFAFYRRCYIEPNFGAEKVQIAFCRSYIFRNIHVIFLDKEIPIKLKLKMALIVGGIYGFFVQRKHL